MHKKTAAVICEFNPFHNGHKYLLDSIRSKGIERIVCIMSGCFVQRGEPALFAPAERLRAAVKNGADLCVALPVRYALSAAESFSYYGVKTAHELGCIDYLCFGADTGGSSEEEFICRCRRIAEFEKNNIDSIKKLMSAGLPYPKALERAVLNGLGCDCAAILRDGNNVLTLNYIKALDLLRSPVKPLIIERKGTMHDSREIYGNIASGACIRELYERGEDVSAFLPYKFSENHANIGYAEKALLYKIRNTGLSEWEALPDIGEQGLANRFYKYRNAASYNDFLHSVKTKRYPMSRLKRIVLCLMTGISAEKTDPAYIHVTAIGSRGREVLHEMKSACSLPVSASLARLSALSPEAERLCAEEGRAYDLYTLCQKETGQGSLSLRQGVVVGGQQGSKKLI